MTTATATLDETYLPVLDRKETQTAVRLLNEFFEGSLAEALNLMRVGAPFCVAAGSGVNDDLNGVEKPVSFRIKSLDGLEAEVVQSLAKWKRLQLAELGVPPGQGIYTDMKALRPDEILDDLHSIFVDQWDWESVIEESQRNVPFLRTIVRRIYRALRRTEIFIHGRYPEIGRLLPKELAFIHAEELERRWPGMPPRQRENLIVREHGAVFVIGIGAPLTGGEPHDGRAPDYDDWITPNGFGHGLNGDLLVWHPVIGRAMELSSMGIRVSPETLEQQLVLRGCTDRRGLPFHRRLLNGELPYSIGGGIGQSRLCMYFLRKAHIGEVQPGIWPEAMRKDCEIRNIALL